MWKNAIFVTGLLVPTVVHAQQRGTFGLPGVAQPARQVTVSVPVEGVLQHLMVQEGSRVEVGQPLAQLDDRVARAAVAAAAVAAGRTSALEHAKQELKLAEIKVDRLESVIDSGAVRTLDLEEARTRLAQAKSSVASAKEAQLQAARNLELEQLRLDRLTIRAPFSGIVTRVASRAGTTLTTQTPLLTLVNLQSLRAELFVPVAQFDKLRVDKEYRLQAGAPVARAIAARLAFVDPVLDSSTGTVRCLFEIPNQGSRLPAGLPVTLLDPGALPARPSGR